jgi:xylulokinase
MPACFLGLDIGTSSVKALLVDREGRVVASASAPLTLGAPRPGWAEQDPEAWWAATGPVIRELLRQAPAITVAAVGITGQMHSSVFLDHTGTVIRPALLWCDARTDAECQQITQRAGGEDRLRALTANAAFAGFTLPKILWLRNHEPDAFARLARVLIPKDYIRYRLTGEMATEPSDASGTLLFDTARGRWSAEMFSAMDLPPSIMPEVGRSAAVLGRVTGEAAHATGLVAGTPVVGGGGDNACGAAGAGVLRPGSAVATWGTSGTVIAPTDAPRVDPRSRVHTFCHVAPDTWYQIGVVLSAGAAFAWLRDQFAREYATPGEATQALVSAAARIPPGAEGLLFLPYLQGERSPHRNPALRGALLGLSLAHTRAHVTRAVIEGGALALAECLDVLRELGCTPGEMLLTGGGVRDPLLRQVLAAVFDLPVRLTTHDEGPAFGAALLAAVGSGAFPDLGAAVAAGVAFRPRELPEPQTREAYRALMRRFQAAGRQQQRERMEPGLADA